MFGKIEKFRILMLVAAAAVVGLSFLLYILESKGFFIDESKYDEIIYRAAEKYDVDPMLIKAVIFRESSFNHKAVGGDGEIGLMQILPEGAVTDWAVFNGRKPPKKVYLFDPALNIDIGTWYLKKALVRWGKYKYGTELALCQYNAGESRAAKWKPEKFDGDVLSRIKIKSTKLYVKKIMNKYRDYKDARSSE